MSYDHRPIPMNIASKVLRCICKIECKEPKFLTTGFFMRVSDTLKFLITSNLRENLINKNI